MVTRSSVIYRVVPIKRYKKAVLYNSNYKTYFINYYVKIILNCLTLKILFSAFYFDIAILHLDSPLTFTKYVRPICLPLSPGKISMGNGHQRR